MNESKSNRATSSVQRVVRPLITCDRCGGTGKHHLREDMQLTLDAVKFLRRAKPFEVATAVLWSGNPSAINNRLEELRRNGLVVRQREGRWWVYRPNDKLTGGRELK